MNKSELIEAISKRTGDSKRATGNNLDAIIEVITNELDKKEKVALVGFGTFERTNRKANKHIVCYLKV